MAAKKPKLRLVKSDVLPRWVLADLKRSGLSPENAAALAIEYVPAAEMRVLMAPVEKGWGVKTPEPPAAYRLPYFDLAGKPTAFARYRFETPYKMPGGRKAQRYWQPPSSGVHFFLPPLLNWKAIAADATQVLWVTEGEKKAAILCALSIPCIGLGGVWNFTSDGDPIPEWNLFGWAQRKVVIAFDSDAAFKSGVQLALKALRKQIIDRDASPFQLCLPQVKSTDKTGVDDFVVARGKEALLKLPFRSLLVPEGTTLDALMTKKFPKLNWIVDDFIPAGLSMLAGAPKIGKSFLGFQLLLAIAAGSRVLGSKTAKCEVMYLALEDTERRLQDRMRTLLGKTAKAIPGVHLHVTWPRIEEDGLLALRRWLDQHPSCRIVLIDTLARMRVKPVSGGHMYLEDYEAMAALKAIADERGIAIVVVYHTRKAKDDDPLNEISGSTGLTGAGDTYLILKRARNNAIGTLFVTGRDIVYEKELAVEYKEGKWSVLGLADEYFMTQERRVIVDALTARGVPMGATELADLLSKKRAAIERLLLKLADDGMVVRGADGKYSARVIDMGKESKF